MQSTQEATANGSPPMDLMQGMSSDQLLAKVVAWLDETKAEKIVSIDLNGKSSLGDYMIIASGKSDRHVAAIAEVLRDKLKGEGFPRVRVEGLSNADWVLVDIGDIIVHVFRPEVRDFYNLEKMWTAERPPETPAH